VALQAVLAGPATAASGAYRQTNLVSDVPGRAATTDSNLVNAWGLTRSATSPWWVADNGTGVSTLYNGQGQPFPPAAPLVVTIPPPAGSPAGTTAAPTGAIFNGTADFVGTEGGRSGPSRFIFASEDGTVSGWNPAVDPTHAILAADSSGAGAVYKGLALASAGSRNLLYATNFRAGTIDVFDGQFSPATVAGSFTDPGIPAGFAPFNIQALQGNLFVTYARQDADREDDVAGPGNGFVDVFTTDGQLLRRLASQGALNSPWGLAIAPSDFSQFSNDLLVGNFGDGRISAFDLRTGAFRGQLRQRSTPITIDGLWALGFGNDANAGSSRTLFFTAGPDEEGHGLFGSIVVAP